MSNKRQSTFTTLSGLAGLTLGVAGTLIWNNRDKFKNASILKTEQVEVLKTKADDVVQFVQSKVEKIKTFKATPVESTTTEDEVQSASTAVPITLEETVPAKKAVASPKTK